MLISLLSLLDFFNNAAQYPRLHNFVFVKKAFFELHLAVFLAGFTAVLGKLIELNEALLVWYRLLFTVLMLFFLMKRNNQLVFPRWREVWKMAGTGVIICFHWVCFYGSVKYGNISVALVCLSASGFFSALLEPLLLKKAVEWIELCLGILAITGIYIIFDFHPQYKAGIIFGMLAALGSSIFPIFNKQLVVRHSARTINLYEFLSASLILTWILPIYLKASGDVFSLPSISDFGWLLILSAVCTVWCFDLQLSALKKISAFTVNLTYNLEPVYGILFAFIFFGESSNFRPAFYLGLGLIMVAVLLQTGRLWRRHLTREETAPHVLL